MCVCVYVSSGGVGVRELYKPKLEWPGPEKWFEWQLRLYWLTSLLMLMHYGNLLHKQKKRRQLYTYLALGALALIGAAGNSLLLLSFVVVCVVVSSLSWQIITFHDVISLSKAPCFLLPPAGVIHALLHILGQAEANEGDRWDMRKRLGCV